MFVCLGLDILTQVFHDSVKDQTFYNYIHELFLPERVRRF